MKVKVRHVGNSLGILIPSNICKEMEIDVGRNLFICDQGVSFKNTHKRLDDFRRNIFIEILSMFDLFDIRTYGINKLEQWRDQGVWSTLHQQWMDVLNCGSDDQLRKTMLSNSDKSIELRQVSPFPGMLPKEIVEKLRGETL